jgi:hypothetical protein
LIRRAVRLYLETLEKVPIHIRDISHGTLLSKNYMIQCVIELTRNLHFTSSIVSCSVVCQLKENYMQ